MDDCRPRPRPRPRRPRDGLRRTSGGRKTSNFRHLENSGASPSGGDTSRLDQKKAFNYKSFTVPTVSFPLRRGDSTAVLPPSHLKATTEPRSKNEMAYPTFSETAGAHVVELRPHETYFDAWLRWEATAPNGHIGPVYIR